MVRSMKSGVSNGYRLAPLLFAYPAKPSILTCLQNRNILGIPHRKNLISYLPNVFFTGLAIIPAFRMSAYIWYRPKRWGLGRPCGGSSHPKYLTREILERIIRVS